MEGERTGLLRNVLLSAERILDATQSPGVRAMDRGGFIVTMRHCTATVSMLSWEVPAGVRARQGPHAHAGFKRIGVEVGALVVRAGSVEAELKPGVSIGISPGTLHTMESIGPASGWATLEPPDPALCEGTGCRHG